ncbi:MAG: RsfS/YbeB/iojap family protein [Bacteroidales bacterium]|nr:RsfS/YbeB/iojap family protein [Bacteroidales bacterium]
MPRISKRVEKQISIKADDAALQAVVLEALQEKKAQDLCAVDFKEALEHPLFDTFIICSATSRTHAEALCENVMRRVYEQFHIEPSHAEGREQSE